ncbi:helicase-related protein [Pseudomonas nitroreducens]|uniref:helicase-related protein n=1 Tax=Pseudomonas nitroreducens TaxID=46680 RepID=UPI0018EF401A|nr:helicase-related protein [Pseudomonas nitroreducens]
MEPCAFGIKIKPAKAESWKITVNASARAWLLDRATGQWIKTEPAKISSLIIIPAAVGNYKFANSEFKKSLLIATGTDGFAARIEADVEIGSTSEYEISISLVNCSPKKHDSLKDTRLYECQLEIKDVHLEPFLLESLEDSFRYDRRVYAYGINCGVTFKEDGTIATEDAITVDRHRPQYWSVEDDMPQLSFDSLSHDPISAAKGLLLSLKKWGKINWGIPTLDKRAADEAWSAGMREQARVAADQFNEECERIAKGILLLEGDEKLLSSFKWMNTAMIKSAKGKYDSWRPFQFGFMLANLQSIVDSDTESEIADVVWFATGGGKTETYLGLLITAVIYDRLMGKISGITAWSRFPLRMLSLQQTQRFANAIISAEYVRRQMGIEGAPFSLGFFVGQGATPNSISEVPKAGEPDPDDDKMPAKFQVLEHCPLCHSQSITMKFNRALWKLEHHCTNSECEAFGEPLPIYVVDDEIYRFLPTIVVGTLDKAASIAMQASMRGMVGSPLAVCSKAGHGYTYAPRKSRPLGCLVPGCKAGVVPLPMDAKRYGPSFRLQDELHLLRDSLGAVDSHYEAIYDSLQLKLCGRKPKILASSATLSGYERQVDVLYRRKARVFPVAPPSQEGGFWTSESPDLMRRFVAIAPRGVTIEYTVDRLLTELQIAIRYLDQDPNSACAEIGIHPKHAKELVSLYGTDVVYGNTLRDLEAVVRSIETQVLADGSVKTASLTGKTDFAEVRESLDRLQNPEENFSDRLHIIAASSMMSHGVDVDRLNVMVMLGIPLSAAEFIQATARVGRKHPGLVFVVHKIGRERDAGVYRAFPQFVAQGDRFVEPIPVTRRSRRVLERTISGLELARILMIHEATSSTPLTTVKSFLEYVRKGGLDVEIELKEIEETLELQSGLDTPLKKDLRDWFDDFKRNIETPPSDAIFPSDLLRSPAMRSLRDVEKQVPIIGRRV